MGTDLHADVEELARLAVASEADQLAVHEFRERYERLPRGTPLPPHSLRRMRSGSSRFLQQQARLKDLVVRHMPAEDAAEGGDRRTRAKRGMIALGAALTLYDNYLALRSVLKGDRIRQLINRPDVGYGIEEDAFRDLAEKLNADDARRRLRKLVLAYDRFLADAQAAEDEDFALLQDLIERSVAYRYVRARTLARHLPAEVTRWRERFVDGLEDLARGTIGTLSEVFGNGIGMVELRKGKLWQREDVARHLGGVLRPLDMLLEKTPFRLTDTFIPGHFGHVAIWLGTAAELDAMALWQDPLFGRSPFDDCEAHVRRGASVLEALRTGVQLSTLAEFLNVDDLAVLRPRALTREQVRASELRAFRQYGKQYDFNFEVETTDVLACSELPYHVYPDVAWATTEQVGSHTISPDQVAAQALGDDAPFCLVTLYHDGRHVPDAEAPGLLDTWARRPA